MLIKIYHKTKTAIAWWVFLALQGKRSELVLSQIRVCGIRWRTDEPKPDCSLQNPLRPLDPRLYAPCADS